MNTVVCNRCGHEQGFAPHTARMKDGVERVYLVCDKCREQYTAYYTDKQIRKLQARQRRIAVAMDGKQPGHRQELYDEYEDNKQKLVIMMFELRRKVEAGPPA